jgi:peptide/nickel transport system permease protein
MLIKFVGRRLLASVIVVLGVTAVTLFLMDRTRGAYVPGIDLNPALRPEDIARLRADLGLEQPFYQWYVTWLWNVLHGDFGRSMIDGSPVVTHILERLPNTLELTLTAVVLGILLSVPLGVIGALRRGSKTDHALTVFSVGGFAVPQFWLGLMLILVFSVTFQHNGWPWLPSGGVTSPFGGGDLGDRLIHLIMPATVLSFFYLSLWSRFTRSSMLEVLSQDYIRTARAKGLNERAVVWRHALPNAMVPIVTVVGLQFGALLAGAIVTEKIFSWPGLGRLVVDAISNRDYALVQGCLLSIGLTYVLVNLLTDVVYRWVNPRMRG